MDDVGPRWLRADIWQLKRLKLKRLKLT